jgi:hypothetical protein
MAGAIMKQLVNQSTKGDWRAVKLLLDILQDIEGRAESLADQTSFGPEDEKVIAQWKSRLSKQKPESDD